MSDSVIHVNDSYNVDRYNSQINKKPAMVLYYMNGCGHCETMKPEWERFESEISMSQQGGHCPYGRCPYQTHCRHRGMRPMVARVNANYLNMVDGHKDVLGFPTILYLKDGKKVSEYNGERSLEGFKRYLEAIEDELEKELKPKARRKKKTTQKRKTVKKVSKKKKASKKTKANKKKVNKKKTTKKK